MLFAIGYFLYSEFKHKLFGMQVYAYKDVDITIFRVYSIKRVHT